MATNLITVKGVQEKSKDGSTWLELTDQDNRTHRIFRRVQDNEGNWHDLSGKYDMIRNSENRSLRLTTEQKGRFTNVLDVESVESSPSRPQVTRRPAEERDAECRLKTFTTAYAKDLAVAGKIAVEDILGWSELLFRYLQGEVNVTDDEVDTVIKKSKAVEESLPASARAATTARRTTNARTPEGVAR
jgi:hypothetical protein